LSIDISHKLEFNQSTEYLGKGKSNGFYKFKDVARNFENIKKLANLSSQNEQFFFKMICRMFLRVFTQAYKLITWQKLKQFVFLTKQFDFFSLFDFFSSIY